jgi:hypothetical protein
METARNHASLVQINLTAGWLGDVVFLSASTGILRCMDSGMAGVGQGQEEPVGAQHVVVVVARDGPVDERGLHPEAVAPVDGAAGVVREEDVRRRELSRVLPAQPLVRLGLEHRLVWRHDDLLPSSKPRVLFLCSGGFVDGLEAELDDGAFSEGT